MSFKGNRTKYHIHLNSRILSDKVNYVASLQMCSPKHLILILCKKKRTSLLSETRFATCYNTCIKYYEQIVMRSGNSILSITDK